MKDVTKRLIIFFIGIPVVAALVFFSPKFFDLPLNIVIIIFCSIAAVEFAAILEKKNFFIKKTEAVILGALAPLAATLIVSFNIPQWTASVIMMTGISWILLSRIFSKAEKLDSVINNITTSFSILIYPGVFMYWLVKMTEWKKPEFVFIFLLMAFGYDSSAWLFGTLFGKGNSRIIPASPNKSIAGFIGGIAGSVIVSFGASLIFPNLFPVIKNQLYSSLPVVFVILLGFFTGIAAALGDLAESAIKRSGNAKDSGSIIIGRGGVLDSIDSVAIAAPVFYLLFNLFYTV